MTHALTSLTNLLAITLLFTCVVIMQIHGIAIVHFPPDTIVTNACIPNVLFAYTKKKPNTKITTFMDEK